MRPIGPQRTISMNPSDGSACGAINIVPPVYLLLLKLRNRQRRSSQSGSSAQRNGAPAQLHQPQENSQQVAELAERLEAAIRERGHIRRKAEAQQIERIELAGGVFQPEQVAGASATFEKRMQGGVRPVLSEIA